MQAAPFKERRASNQILPAGNRKSWPDRKVHDILPIHLDEGLMVYSWRSLQYVHIFIYVYIWMTLYQLRGQEPEPQGSKVLK